MVVMKKLLMWIAFIVWLGWAVVVGYKLMYL